MTRKFIVLTKEGLEPGDLYIDPEIYCTINIDVKHEPDDGCICEWKMTEDHDTWSQWECTKCDGKVAAEVWD